MTTFVDDLLFFFGVWLKEDHSSETFKAKLKVSHKLVWKHFQKNGFLYGASWSAISAFELLIQQIQPLFSYKVSFYICIFLTFFSVPKDHRSS
jgi:hypothetical protein